MPNSSENVVDPERAPARRPDDPTRYWVGRNGSVVCNKPRARMELSMLRAIDSVNFILAAIDEWNFYGGFLVCESCSPGDAERIVEALNFVEGVPTEILTRAPFTRLLPTHNWQG